MLILSLDLNRAVADYTKNLTLKVAAIQQAEARKAGTLEDVEDLNLTVEEKKWLENFNKTWLSGEFTTQSSSTPERKKFLQLLDDRKKFVVYHYSEVVNGYYRTFLKTLIG